MLQLPSGYQLSGCGSVALRRHSSVVFVQLQWLRLPLAILQGFPVAKTSELEGLCVAEGGRAVGVLGSEGCWGFSVLFCSLE